VFPTFVMKATCRLICSSTPLFLFPFVNKHDTIGVLWRDREGGGWTGWLNIRPIDEKHNWQSRVTRRSWMTGGKKPSRLEHDTIITCLACHLNCAAITALRVPADITKSLLTLGPGINVRCNIEILIYLFVMIHWREHSWLVWRANCLQTSMRQGHPALMYGTAKISPVLIRPPDNTTLNSLKLSKFTFISMFSYSRSVRLSRADKLCLITV
jgi:hypothetical protein